MLLKDVANCAEFEFLILKNEQIICLMEMIILIQLNIIN